MLLRTHSFTQKLLCTHCVQALLHRDILTHSGRRVYMQILYTAMFTLCIFSFYIHACSFTEMLSITHTFTEQHPQTACSGTRMPASKRTHTAPYSDTPAAVTSCRLKSAHALTAQPSSSAPSSSTPQPHPAAAHTCPLQNADMQLSLYLDYT